MAMVRGVPLVSWKFMVTSRLLLGAWCCCLLGGCGEAEYEARLQNSRDLFEYLQSLDRACTSPAWIRNDLGLAMRLPKPFKQPLPAPAVPKDDKGNPLPVQNDPRQPQILGVDLPGLEEAFRAELPGSGGGEAMFFICTNHQRFRDRGPQTPDPGTLLTELELAVQAGFGVTFLDDDRLPENARYRLQAPKGGLGQAAQGNARFTTPKEFQAVRISPPQAVGGQEIEGMLFRHEAGLIQVGILVVFPRSASSQFRENVLLSLETLSASSEVPRPRSGSAGAAGGGRTPGF